MPSTRSARRWSTPTTFALLGLAFVPFVSAGQTIYGYSGNRIRGSLSDNTTTQFSTSGWRIGCNATDAACPREQQLTMVSRTAGSTFTLPFTGTGVQVNGSVVLNAGTTQTLSADSVSDYLSLTLDAVPYSPAGLAGNDYNQVLFNSTTIADGSHTLVLTIKGGATVGIRYVTVNTVDVVSSSTSPSPTAAAIDSASSALPTATDLPEQHGTPITDSDVGAFVATAVMAFILLIVGIFLFIRRRKAKKNAPPSDKGKEMVDMKEKDVDGDVYSDDGSTRGLTTLAKSGGGKSSAKWEGSTRQGSDSSSMYKAKALAKPSLATLTHTQAGRRDDDQVWDKVGNWRDRSDTPDRDHPKVHGGVGENLHNWRQRTGADKYESGTTDTSLPSFVDSDRERARRERERARDEKEKEFRRYEPNSPLSPAPSEQLPAYRPAQEDRRPREREREREREMVTVERKDSNPDSWARERLARREREEMSSPVNRPRPERGDSRSNRNGRPNSREAPVFTGRGNGNDQGRLMVQQSERDGRHRSDTSMLQQVSRSEAW